MAKIPILFPYYIYKSRKPKRTIVCACVVCKGKLVSQSTIYRHRTRHFFFEAPYYKWIRTTAGREYEIYLVNCGSPSHPIARQVDARQVDEIRKTLGFKQKNLFPFTVYANAADWNDEDVESGNGSWRHLKTLYVPVE